MTPRPQMPSMIKLLQRRVMILLVFLITMSLGAITLYSMAFDEADLRSDFEDNMDGAATSLQSKLHTLLAPDLSQELNTDLNPERISALFRETLKIEKEFVYLAIMDDAGKLIIETGLRPPGLGRSTQHAPKFLAGEQIVRALELSPTSGGGKLKALIGVRENQLNTHLKQRNLFLLIVCLIFLWVGYEARKFIFSITVISPMNRVWGLMGRIGDGDFRGRLAPASSTVFSPLIHTLNQIIARANNHYVYMQSLANNLEEKNNATSEQTRKRLGAHLSQLLNRFHFAEGGAAQVLLARSPEDIRFVLFLFVFAEELSRSFFPQFARSFPVDVNAMSTDMFIALPISLFLLSSILVLVFSEILNTRFGPRRLLVIGAILAVVGFTGTALSESAEGLLASRGLSGLAYGLIIATCQTYVARMATEEDWAQGICAFIVPLSIGALLGASMGGILAEHLPFNHVFLISAVTSVIGLGVCFMAIEKPPESIAPPPLSMNFSWVSDFSNFRYLMFILFGAIPARLMVSAILFYLVPLYLSDIGNGPAMIGLVLMIYYLFIAFGSPLLARLADKYELLVLPVFAGSMISGAVMLGLGQWQNTLTLTIVVGFLGIGHTLIIAPLISALPKVSGATFQSTGPAAGLNLYRICEGTGAIAGPILAAILSARFGYTQAFFYLACFNLLSALVFGGFFMFARLVPVQPVENPLPDSQARP